MDAIRALRAIEGENRLAAPPEQDVLARYVGWGGIPQAFDDKNDSWRREYEELKELLSEDEYASARASTLNAFYSSPTVIRAMYEGLNNLGFKRGNILEPSMGTGNFFGLLPDEMRESKLFGVELDSLSGRIARQLYQTADVRIAGFEKTDFPDNFFDAAVGNVPFGGYSLADRRYDKHGFLIHDYFFAKAMDKVRPDGIVAFITSKGTLDKRNPGVRRYLAQRADLIGAIRLPNDAFAANAGTSVTSDIIFLQKRDHPRETEPDWVHLRHNEDGLPINGYFAQNPHMVLGRMEQGNSLYGNDDETTCTPVPGANLADQLAEAIGHIRGNIVERTMEENERTAAAIPADPNVRNYSFTLVNDELYFRVNSEMNKAELPRRAEERVRGLIGLRDCCRELIDYQLQGYDDAAVAGKQAELNRLYDDFARAYGLINSRGNKQAFAEDSSYYLLCSLEILREGGELERKADMFTRRTIRRHQPVTRADTASEALAVSIAERGCVDLDFMSRLTGFESAKIVEDLQGVIFRNPAKTDQLGRPFHETADEYLSGNVREKLRLAREWADKFSDEYASNVQALELAQPQDLSAGEIDVRLGASWIDATYIDAFIHELLDPPPYCRDLIRTEFSPLTAEWGIEGKGVDSGSILATVKYGTSRMNAYQIIEDTLNLRDAQVFDLKRAPDGTERRVLDAEETMLAQKKQEAVRDAFRDWIFEDPHRRETLVQKYNETFNAIRTRAFDGSHITFAGMNPEITLQPHQRNAVARGLYGDNNTLLAHEVGAGKTFEMAAIAMESKRLGLCEKSLFAVPNHLTEQMAAEFLRLYPAANILVATKKDFEKANRKKFCSRIATGDYDAVIMGHSQFERIPISQERQERFLNEQISEITESIEALEESRGSRFSIKQLEKSKRSLEGRLLKLLDTGRKDDVVTFEELGVDRLFIDEAHGYKNLMLTTKMRNVAGISTSEAQKSSDLHMKCRYMDEATGGKGIIFATGTPISNSMSEMFTMQRYLQADALKSHGLSHFDAWASVFGETTTVTELAPEGGGYRARTRFAMFHNLPELMTLFKQVADIRTADTLDLPRPNAHFHNIAAKPTDDQIALIDSLSVRAKMVHDRQVEPNVDNMLTITSDGRKIGLDQRLIDPSLPDDPRSKVNICAREVHRIWEETKENRSTQLVFCDFSTPGKGKPFNIYDDMRGKLIRAGVPEREIAFIHDADTEAKKEALFSRMRKGEVRVLFGSTPKMGAGTNVQDRLIALHDLDAPWRPSDLQQRAGRIVRQGNLNPDVHIYRYVTEGTFDSYLYQTLEHKQKFIGQVMTSKSPVRSCEDVDETALSYAEVKALCAGNPLIKEKMDLDIEVGRLRVLRSQHQRLRYDMEDKILKQYPERIRRTEARIGGLKDDLDHLNESTRENEDGFSPMTILGTTYTKKNLAGEALIEVREGIGTEPTHIGEYRGFDMFLSFNAFEKAYQIELRHTLTHYATLGGDAFGNITRLNNVLNGIGKGLETADGQLADLHKQMENAKEALAKPFPQEEELERKSARLAELDAELNMDRREPMGAKAALTPEEWKKEVKGLKLLEGTPNIIENPQGGPFKGEILHVAPLYVVQKMGQKTLLIHDTKKLSQIPEKGDLVHLKNTKEGKLEPEKIVQRNSQNISM